MNLPVVVVLFLVCMTPAHIACSQIVPLTGAHAHNDYNNERPLIDALSYGFTSIEVDVLLIENEIYVGHDLPDGSNLLPTLTDIYLQPLDSIMRRNGGALYPGYNQESYLMIDIKTEAEETYRMLKKLLQTYKSWIRQYEAGIDQKGKLTIFLSGNRPVKTVTMDPERLVSLDGRPEDLGKGYSPDVMPVISQSYHNYSKWKGVGDMPVVHQEKIRALAKDVHSEGKLLRLWAIPDMKNGWRMLKTLGVDMINTDDLEGFRDYFLEEKINKVKK